MQSKQFNISYKIKRSDLGAPPTAALLAAFYYYSVSLSWSLATWFAFPLQLEICGRPFPAERPDGPSPRRTQEGPGAVSNQPPDTTGNCPHVGLEAVEES